MDNPHVTPQQRKAVNIPPAPGMIELADMLNNLGYRVDKRDRLRCTKLLRAMVIASDLNSKNLRGERIKNYAFIP